MPLLEQGEAFDVGAPPSADPKAERTRVAVLRLELAQFRSYAALRLELEPGPVVLIGPNGAGKTNLLEALSFLAPGRGLRRAKLDEVAHRAPGDPQPVADWSVATRLRIGADTVAIGTGRALEPGKAERRVVRIDGAPHRGQASLSERLSVLWLTPEMDRLFDGPASARRRFLDRLAAGFDPAHAERLLGYERALKERTRLLSESGFDRAWLDAIEERLSELGVALAIARRDCVARLARARTGTHAPFPDARLALDHGFEARIEERPALAVEEDLRRALRDNRLADSALGGATEGPHRADLLVAHAESGRRARDCSTGQQKALVVGLILSGARAIEAATGRPPLLLLDEVTAHLDRARREALFDALADGAGQVWLAGAEAEPFAPLAGRAQFLAVADGKAALHG